jgi:hypothetical protein
LTFWTVFKISDISDTWYWFVVGEWNKSVLSIDQSTDKWRTFFDIGGFMNDSTNFVILIVVFTLRDNAFNKNITAIMWITSESSGVSSWAGYWWTGSFWDTFTDIFEAWTFVDWIIWFEVGFDQLFFGLISWRACYSWIKWASNIVTTVFTFSDSTLLFHSPTTNQYHVSLISLILKTVQKVKYHVTVKSSVVTLVSVSMKNVQ